jgi:hypothetical protein
MPRQRIDGGGRGHNVANVEAVLADVRRLGEPPHDVDDPATTRCARAQSGRLQVCIKVDRLRRRRPYLVEVRNRRGRNLPARVRDLPREYKICGISSVRPPLCGSVRATRTRHR